MVGSACIRRWQALLPLWQREQLAAIEGVGYPNPNLSHFAAMDIWQTLDLNGQGGTGWLGKYVSGFVDKDGHPFDSLAVGTSLPSRAERASTPTCRWSRRPRSYRLQPDAERARRSKSGTAAKPA